MEEQDKPRYQSTMGFTVRVLVFALVLLVPGVLLAFYFAGERGADVLAQTQRQALTIAKVLASQQANSFGSVEHDLSTLSSVAGGSDGALFRTECQAHLTRITDANSLYEDILLLDRSGMVVCSGRPRIDPWIDAGQLADQSYFRQAVASKRFFLSEGVQRHAGRWTLAAAEPLLDSSGEVHAVLVARIHLARLQELMSASVLLPPQSGIGLLDSSGRILGAVPRGDFIGRISLDAPDLLRQWAQSPEGFFDSVGMDGIERVWAYAEVPGRKLVVRVGMPKGAITAARHEALRTALFPAGPALLLTLLLGWFGARVLVLKPVRQLTDAAEKLGAGDWEARTGLPHEDHAIGRLARKLDELAAHAQRKTRALTALSACNRTILRETSEPALLRAMCEVAVEKAGYRVAMVSYAQKDEEKSVTTMASAGADESLTRGLRLTWADTERGQGTVGAAIRTGVHCAVQSIANDPRLRPWREEALKHNFGAIVSLPLRADGEVIGALTLLATEENAFDEEEIGLLEELAADLSFGISGIRSRVLRQDAERRLAHAATHDPATGLPNAASFLATLSAALAEAGARQEPLTVLAVHLPRLQDVYDSLGHDPGSAVVGAMAARLRNLLGEGPPVARTANDEFAVALVRSDARAGAQIAQSILHAAQASVMAGGAPVELQAAVGASYFPGHGEEPGLLLRRAGIAAREAARKGNSYAPYQGATERENPARLAMAVGLRTAIEQRALLLHYQPKLELATSRITSCEALVRWPRPGQGMISPAQFIPVAEQTGLIRELTYYVLDAAVRQQRAWLGAGRRLPVAVNLSVRNLYDPRLLERVEGLLATWGVPAELLEFEITESALMEEPETAKASVFKLRDLGSKIYIDDFGTGYSSLAYLVSLPVHALKIDRAFVTQMGTTPEAKSIVASIISMAHGLKLRVVAEGVETEAEVALLQALGCDEIQGYHVGRPASAEDLERLVFTPRRYSGA